MDTCGCGLHDLQEAGQHGNAEATQLLMWSCVLLCTAKMMLQFVHIALCTISFFSFFCWWHRLPHSTFCDVLPTFSFHLRRNSKQMPTDVLDALKAVACSEGRKSASEASAFLADLERSRRLQFETWSWTGNEKNKENNLAKIYLSRKLLPVTDFIHCIFSDFAGIFFHHFIFIAGTLTRPVLGIPLPLVSFVSFADFLWETLATITLF